MPRAADGGGTRWLPLALITALLISACAVIQHDVPARIGLLAPFEGRYREIGYQALYAARLELRDSALSDRYALLPIDDGGSAQAALQRAAAFARDPSVVAVVVLGYAATDRAVLEAFANLPVIAAGHWGITTPPDSVFVLANAAQSDGYTLDPRAEITAIDAPSALTGGDILALEAARQIIPGIEQATLLSSAQLPEVAYTERYRASDPFAPEPNLIAALSADAFRYVLGNLARHDQDPSRADLLRQLQTSGDFANGFRVDAPIYRYQFAEDGALIPAEMSE
jgi:hypothetical protein